MKERVFGVRTGQEPSIGGQRIKRTKETEALDEFTHKRIYGDHTFRFELAEWHSEFRKLFGPASSFKTGRKAISRLR